VLACGNQDRGERFNIGAGKPQPVNRLVEILAVM